MKKISILFTLLLSSVFLQAQEGQHLEIDYQMELKMDLESILSNVPSEWRSAVEEPLRQEINNGIFVDYKLKTNGRESEYKMQEKIRNDQSPAGMIISQITATDKEPLYKNIDENYYIKPYDVGKRYLMQDSLQDFKWKISREKVQISGFDTYKATGVMNDSIQITAWYTPRINIKDGPDRVWGLPGLILKTEFEVSNIHFIITAINVTPRNEEITIPKPTRGTVLTEKEFYDEMRKLSEMQKEMYGGGIDKD